MKVESAYVYTITLTGEELDALAEEIRDLERFDGKNIMLDTSRFEERWPLLSRLKREAL